MEKIEIHDVFARRIVELLKNRGGTIDKVILEYRHPYHLLVVYQDLNNTPSVNELEEGIDGLAKAAQFISKQPESHWKDWRYVLIKKEDLEECYNLNRALMRGLEAEAKETHLENKIQSDPDGLKQLVQDLTDEERDLAQ